MEDWKEHPEVRYREGYEEGAWALFNELRESLPLETTQSILDWLTKELEPWRMKAQRRVAAHRILQKTLPPRCNLNQDVSEPNFERNSV
jgi:hypothetical protein